MITIRRHNGGVIFETPINTGSKRVRKLMGDDYVTLKFSSRNPIRFEIGDYCDVPGFGRFVICEQYKPAYNTSTNAYDYELKLESQYMLWRNKLMRYLPKFGGMEVSFVLTATATVHMEAVLANVEYLCSTSRMYHYNGMPDTTWKVSVDPATVDASAKTISYEGTNIIDALNQIAEQFECEWWVKGEFICLGKWEETNYYIDLETNVNVQQMVPQDSTQDFASRIIICGGERNISPRYRKELLFDVKEVTEKGIRDSARIIQPDWFPESMQDPHEVEIDDGTVPDDVWWQQTPSGDPDIHNPAEDNTGHGTPTNRKTKTVIRVLGITLQVIGESGEIIREIKNCTLNAGLSDSHTEASYLNVPGGLSKGTRYKLPQILEYKVKSSYFTSKYKAYSDTTEIVTNGIVTDRLMLPESYGKPYVDVIEGLPDERHVEDLVVFDDVYPGKVCTVTSVSTVERTEDTENDDGTKSKKSFTAFCIRDDFFTPEHPFSEDYKLPNKNFQITFQDGKRYKEGDEIPKGKHIGDYVHENCGKLNGWTFDAQFKDCDGYAEWEIVRDNTSFIPNELICPAVGDQFVITNVDIGIIDALYVQEAENELLERARKYIKKLNTDTKTYECTMMSDSIKNGLVLDMGKRVNLLNKMYFEETIEDGRRWGRKSRVIGYEIALDIPYDNPKYTIGEKPVYSRFGQIEDSIEALKFSMADNHTTIGVLSGTGNSQTSNVAGNAIHVIGTSDPTPPSDTNVLSSLLSLLLFCSKKAAEIINQIWTFAKGIKIGNFMAGAKGAQVTEEGNAELESLIVRGDTTVKGDLSFGGTLSTGSFKAGSHGGGMWTDELGRVHFETDFIEARLKLSATEVEIKEQTHVGGIQILSPAAMRCSRVISEVAITQPISMLVDKCFFPLVDADGFEVQNQFRVGDLARCQTFNLVTQTDGKVGNRYYWREVVGVGVTQEGDSDYDEKVGKEGYILLARSGSKYTDTESTDYPQPGDRIVTVGNRTEPERQNLIIIASYGSGSPYIYQYKGINTFALTRENLKMAISPNGNLFTGKFVIENSGEETDIDQYLDSKSIYLLTLTNEMAAVSCDDEGNPLVSLPSTDVRVFKGNFPDSGWSFSLDCEGCTAKISGNTVTVRSLTSDRATITINARKEGCVTLSKEMVVVKVRNGRQGENGKHAVEYSLVPSANLIIRDIEGNITPQSLECKAYIVIGDHIRQEVPLRVREGNTVTLVTGGLLFYDSSTGEDTLYDTFDDMLNDINDDVLKAELVLNRYFILNPVQTGVPENIYVTYKVTREVKVDEKDEKNDETVMQYDSETEYRKPIALTGDIRSIEFNLYRNGVLLDRRTVYSQLGTDGIRKEYKSMFEVTDRKFTSRFEEVETAVATTNERVSEIKQTANDMTLFVSAIDGKANDIINGAGRNLLLDTGSYTFDDFKYYTNVGAGKGSRKSIEANAPTTVIFIRDILRGNAPTWESFGYKVRGNLIKGGEDYTASFKIELPAYTRDLQFYVVIADTHMVTTYSEKKYIIVEQGKECYEAIPLKATRSATEMDDICLHIGVVSADLRLWEQVTFREMKLEKGKVATPYVEAQEDVYRELGSRISVYADRVETLSSYFDSNGKLVNQAGLVTTVDFKAWIDGNDLVFPDGNISTFSGLFVREMKENGVFTQADMSVYLVKDENGEVTSNALIRADKISLDGNVNIGDHFKISEDGSLLEAYNAVFNGYLRTNFKYVRDSDALDMGKAGLGGRVWKIQNNLNLIFDESGHQVILPIHEKYIGARVMIANFPTCITKNSCSIIIYTENRSVIGGITLSGKNSFDDMPFVKDIYFLNGIIEFIGVPRDPYLPVNPLEPMRWMVVNANAAWIDIYD